jgi:dihydroorotase
MRTLIRNPMAVLPSGTRVCSVLVEGTRIADIDVEDVSADRVVDASGLYLIPGVVDDQVHFREPGLEHKEDLVTATRASAKGGVTSFLDMPNTVPPTISQAALDDKLSRAARRSLVNYGFFIGATPDNLGELVSAQRTPGIKIFIGSSTGDLLVDDQETLERIFAHTSLPITAHCEDETTVRANRARLTGTPHVRDHSRIRDHQAAYLATQRAIDLAIRHQHRFHVLHVSTADEIPLIHDHRNLITGEVCPHHLFFNIEDYERLGTLVQMNPSVKTRADNEALLHALVTGQIQVIATDHAPHTLAEKSVGYPASPSGIPAVENSLALMLDQVHRRRCTIEQVVQWMCDAPARVWDMVGKGRIEIGYDADLVLVDPNLSHVIENGQQETKCGWSPWHGTRLTGKPVMTWVMGRLVFDHGQFDDTVPGQEIQFDHSLGGYWRHDANVG